MPVWTIEDDCIAKASKLTLNFAGPNPFSIYQKIRAILMITTLVKKEHIWEREFRWDTVASDTRGFYIRLYVYKKVDGRTFMFFEVIFQGKQPIDLSKSGNLTMSISARLVTNYGLYSTFQQSVLYRSFLRLYHMLFFNDIRRRSLDECGKFIDKILERVRNEFNLETKEPVHISTAGIPKK